MRNCKSILLSFCLLDGALGIFELLPVCRVVHHYSSSPRCKTWSQQNVPDDWHTSHQPLLSHSLGFSPALPDINKTLIWCILLFQRRLSVSRFLPTELPFLRTDWLQALAIYLFYSCLCVSECARTILWLCIRFSGITQGGKHRLIKSSSSPWWMPLSIHCCLLRAVTQRGSSSLIQFKVYASEGCDLPHQQWRQHRTTSMLWSHLERCLKMSLGTRWCWALAHTEPEF